MKANEFVKKHGISAASELVNESEWSIKQLALATTTSMLDLKRLVESYELVEKHQGLNGTRNVLKLLEASLDIGLYHGIDGVDANTEVPMLKQAIADVESCMEVS